MKTEIKNKILYTIFLLFLYRIGTFIFLPGINGEVINDFFNSDTGSVFNLLQDNTFNHKVEYEKG